MPKKRNIILTRNLHIEEEEKHENMEVGIGHFVYDFICNRDISVMRGRRCKLTVGKWGDVRLGRCIRSDSDACGRYRIRGNEKFGEEGRKYRFDCSVRSGSTGRIYRFRKLLRSCNLVRLVPDQCGLGSCGDDKEQIKIIYI